MAAYKYTMIFNYISGGSGGVWKNIPGGWSESVYHTNYTPTILDVFKTLARIRAWSLPNYTKITALRVQQVDPTTRARLLKVNYPGNNTATYAQDAPQVSLLIPIPTSITGHMRLYRLACVPDRMVTRGEYDPTPGFGANVREFVTALPGWYMRGEDFTNARKLIKTISATGEYVLGEAQVLAVGNRVNVYSTVQANGKKVSGQFIVDTYTDSTHGVLRNWTHGATTLGQMRLFTPVYPALQPIGITDDQMDVIVRKIGRPSRKYVGRQNRR